MQRADSGADVHRARFHSSMLDTKMLKAKQKFKEIHDSYVIFITENDYMKKGLPLYHVERVVQETEGGRGQVCKAMEERIKRERSEERIEVLLGTVKSLMENMQLSAQQVMAAMNISEEDKQKLIKKL